MLLKSYLAKTPKKHLIFDLDETLVTLHIDWSKFREGLWQKVSAIDQKLVKEVLNRSGMASMLYNKAIINHGSKAKEIVMNYWARYEVKYFSGITKNKTLIDFLKKNSNKYNFYIWTSNTKRIVNKVIRELSIASDIKKVITQEDVNLLKPYPDGFYLIYNSGTQEREDYLMIGDSDNDKLAAKAAEIDFLRISHNAE